MPTYFASNHETDLGRGCPKHNSARGQQSPILPGRIGCVGQTRRTDAPLIAFTSHDPYDVCSEALLRALIDFLEAGAESIRCLIDGLIVLGPLSVSIRVTKSPKALITNPLP